MTFRVGWGQRAIGLSVLVAVLVVAALMRFDLPLLTWIVFGIFGVAAAGSTIANFGDRVHADDEGLRRENVVLARVGLRRRERVAWSDIASAIDLDGRTVFLTLDGGDRWVLDSFADHEALTELLRSHGIRVEERRRPRLRDFGRGPRTPS